jgi:release factor glutamine methyltransferase
MNMHARLTEAQKLLAETLKLDAREARLEARLLMQAALRKDHAWLLAHEHDGLDAEPSGRFASALERRLSGEPVAYILGKREFFGLELHVTPDTLIPRPDTETLVEAALQQIAPDRSCKVLDLGTGSGAIALAIAATRPLAEVTAVDASADALEVATANAAALGISNVRFVQSNWLSNLPGQIFDLIVSNPPYIPSADEHLRQGDLRFEPLSALASGIDGLDDIRKIVAAAPQHLIPGGMLLLEHGYDQSACVADLMLRQGFEEVTHHPDLAGILRVTAAKWNQPRR